MSGKNRIVSIAVQPWELSSRGGGGGAGLVWEANSTSTYTVKKVTDFPVSSWDVTYQTLPGRE